MDHTPNPVPLRTEAFSVQGHRRNVTEDVTVTDVTCNGYSCKIVLLAVALLPSAQ